VQCAAVFLVWPLIASSNQQLQLKRRNEPSSQNMNPVNVPKTVRPNESYIVTIDSHNKEGRKWRKEGRTRVQSLIASLLNPNNLPAKCSD